MYSKSYRKLLATAATAALVTGGYATTVSAEKDFSDVNERYQDAVHFMLANGINGISDSQFGTDKDIKRVDAAIMLANVLELDTKNAPDSGFTDVPSRARGAVNALKAAHITSGKTDTTFGASDTIKRGELAIWIQKGFELKGLSETSFSDASDRYNEAIKALVANQITSGVSDTSFGIETSAKRGDFAIFLHKSDQAAAEKFELSVMHSNDTHAHIDNIAKKATVVKEIRSEKPHALLLDAGDVFSGSLYFNEFLGQADLEFMNYLGYDAMTFGNHEFDLGASTDGHKALADFVKTAEFPFVSANVDFTGDSLFNGIYHGGTIADAPMDGNIYDGIIKEVNGEKIGIFGLTTEETPQISSPVNVTFSNYIDEAKQAVQAFKAQGVNKIVAITHIGFDDNSEFDNDLELAKAVEGIDIIVGGHTHSELDAPVLVEAGKDEPTVIVQAKEYNKYLGMLGVDFDSEGKMIGFEGDLIAIDDFAEDTEALGMFQPYKTKIEELEKQTIGVATTVNLDGERADVRTKETNLGNLITDGMLEKAQSINPQTVIAMTNGGGIRASIPAGDITLGQILTTMPFGNSLAIMNLTGAEISTALEHSVSQAPNASGAFLHVSGMKFTYDSSKPAGERVISAEVKGQDGTYSPVNETSTYFVATNTFTAKGGDGYDVFKTAYTEGRVSEPGFVDYEMFKNYLQKSTSITPGVEGRIVDTATPAE
ncbi:5'-nucleotidase C-terminal domain-containing protein [Cytobacillus spongiae]|uniref:5'-nucleotidase C-terminal domain-containing protein n=1 Tax=Cytobacillus spongiae TaxID=2901381 RepID=UPI001F199F92|nr:5'-nucleotidase C-terminal domain-containing protein [Cytobacillus spongiae]UII55646.1 5'-nucleotidase C-terminal domain-containing protein [Cytobacillus spongiae]